MPRPIERREPARLGLPPKVVMPAFKTALIARRLNI
jgi:hypothetical protein